MQPLIVGARNVFGDVQPNGLELNITDDPEIKKLEINARHGLAISSITGHNLSTIEISGQHLDINNFCMFTDITRMPNLSCVHIQDATLVNFKRRQFINCSNEDSQNGDGHLDVR